MPRYRLCRDMSALTSTCKAQILTVPAGSTVSFFEQSPDESGMIRVVWKNRTLRMFAVDLEARTTRHATA